MSAMDTKSKSAPVADVVAELRRFLELGAAQLDAAVRESDERVEKLTSAVMALATDVHALERTVCAPGSGDAATLPQASGRIRELTQSLSGHVQDSIAALQFYDKLVQRLTHVREGLVMPADCAAVKPAAVNWAGLLEQVRARYSTTEERVLFDFMVRGLNADQMLTALTGLRASTSAGEFEAL
jgi:hypothetical protein